MIDDSTRFGIVFPSWRIPETRLQDHFVWNARYYNSAPCRVFVVADREYDLPDYAECVIFPEDKLPILNGIRRFATTRCRNAGIQAAIAAGCDPIMCTEVDIAFEPKAWDLASFGVPNWTSRTALVPHCRMSYSSDWHHREDHWIAAPLATGTVTMKAKHWGEVSYCEQQWGYGCDDGLFLKRLAKRDMKVRRTGYIYHIAHVDGAEQREFHGRGDHWNRASGFNPSNFRHNGTFE